MFMKHFIRNSIAVLIVVCACSFFVARGQETLAKSPTPQESASNPSPSSQQKMQRQEWVAKCLKEMQSIKVGMMRKDLAEFFTTEGGIYSPGWGHYVHRECPYFKVNVEFTFSRGKDGRGIWKPTDRITKLSKPYLEWPIAD